MKDTENTPKLNSKKSSFALPTDDKPTCEDWREEFRALLDTYLDGVQDYEHKSQLERELRAKRDTDNLYDFIATLLRKERERTIRVVESVPSKALEEYLEHVDSLTGELTTHRNGKKFGAQDISVKISFALSEKLKAEKDRIDRGEA
jgi:hypothetical protein